MSFFRIIVRSPQLYGLFQHSGLTKWYKKTTLGGGKTWVKLAEKHEKLDLH